MAKEEEGDPFARPEPELLVGDLSPTHYALLNKYNVLDGHLLAVTRAPVDQEARLELADFEALTACIGTEPVLGFYNGGADAGASQRHRHMQAVRLPLSPERAIPIEALDDERRARLPFRHTFGRIAAGPDTRAWARTLHARYREALEPGPYNLLVTRDWMMYVPRSEAEFEGIPVNSLAFAGALFVRSDAELRVVERAGPMAVLTGVARSAC